MIDCSVEPAPASFFGLSEPLIDPPKDVRAPGHSVYQEEDWG